MKYCIYCGKKLIAEARFCHNCGKKIPEIENPVENPKKPDPGDIPERFGESWTKVLSILKKEVMPSCFAVWMEPIVPYYIDESENVLALLVSNDMSKTILEKRYAGIIQQAVAQCFGREYNIVFFT